MSWKSPVAVIAGYIHRQVRKENDVALRESDAAITVTPKLPQAHFMRARLLASMGRSAEAGRGYAETAVLSTGQLTGMAIVGMLDNLPELKLIGEVVQRRPDLKYQLATAIEKNLKERSAPPPDARSTKRRLR